MVNVTSGVGWVMAVLAAALVPSTSWATSGEESLAAGVELPTGKAITPTTSRGAVFQDLDPGHPDAPDLRAGQAAAQAISPDGRTLAILTSGYNLYMGADGLPIPGLSTEYVFLFDISTGTPAKQQVLPLPNSFEGLSWAPSSQQLYVSGGSDDKVLELVRNRSTFEAGRTFLLGHEACAGLNLPTTPKYWANYPTPRTQTMRRCGPVTGSLAVSPDGKRLLVANIQNDSVSLIDLVEGKLLFEQDLRPGVIDSRRRGQPGGTYPRSVAWISPSRAYVASERDREVISLSVSGERLRVTGRMSVRGQPIALLANPRGSRLFVALDTTNRVVVFETAHNRVVESFDVIAPATVYDNTRMLGGGNTDALALTPDGRTLLVSNGGQNAVAVVRLSDRASDLTEGRLNDADGDGDDEGEDDGSGEPRRSAVVGLVPTGRYPTGVGVSKDGHTWYVSNYKSSTSTNVNRCRAPGQRSCLPQDWWARRPGQVGVVESNRATLAAQNQATFRLEKAGLLSLPAPTPAELARLTRQVARNNHFDRAATAAADERLFGFLRQHIRHVIYIVKENKTYDEVLGDLTPGNGDPSLTYFPESFTPNHHAIARNFVTLDNFLVTGAGSWTGWDWSVSAQTNDYRERTEALASASSTVKNEGFMEGEPGINRNLNMAYASNAERHRADPLSPPDPDLLPGARDVAESDGPGGQEGKGNIWQAALAKGLTVRNWGFFGGFFRTLHIPFVHDPFARGLRVFFPVRPALMAISDPYYYSFDPGLPDYWRVQEWKREFESFVAARSAPDLMLVQLTNDHTGDYANAIDGVNTVDTQVADNDYALGLIVETVANSPFAGDTLIVSVEDDPLGGLDHVDAFRSVALFAGPYVRQHVVVSKRYTTVNLVKTIEAILGIDPIGLNDALASPMSEVFDPELTAWSYKPIVPDVLRSTQLPLPASAGGVVTAPRRSAAYWSKVMAGQDFSQPDRINAATYTRALWRGLMGDRAVPREAKGAGYAAPGHHGTDQ